MAAAGVDPGVEVVAAVEDAAAEAEAGRAGAQVASVAQGGDGSAQELGGLGDGEQRRGGLEDVVAARGLVRHGWLRGWTDVVAVHFQKAPFDGHR